MLQRCGHVCLRVFSLRTLQGRVDSLTKQYGQATNIPVDGSPTSTLPVNYGENAAITGEKERLNDHLSVVPNRLNGLALSMRPALTLSCVLSMDANGASALDVYSSVSELAPPRIRYQQSFDFFGINNHKSAGVRKVLVIIAGVVAIQRRSKWRRFSNSE